jgi:hypothetical protein
MSPPSHGTDIINGTFIDLKVPSHDYWVFALLKMYFDLSDILLG